MKMSSLVPAAAAAVCLLFPSRSASLLPCAASISERLAPRRRSFVSKSKEGAQLDWENFEFSTRYGSE